MCKLSYPETLKVEYRGREILNLKFKGLRGAIGA